MRTTPGDDTIEDGLEFQPERSPMREAYELLGARTPKELYLRYCAAEQVLFSSRAWNYDDPDQLIQKVKRIVAQADERSMTPDEVDWSRSLLWFWYHHAISCAAWRRDVVQARAFAAMALSPKYERDANNITRLWALLLDDRLEEAEAFVLTIDEDRQSAEETLEDYRQGRLI